MCHVLAKDNEVHALARFTDPRIRAEIEEKGAVIWQKDLVKDRIDDLPEHFDAIYYEAMVFPKGEFTRKIEDDALEVNGYRIGDILYHCRNTPQVVIGSTGGLYPKGPHKCVEGSSLTMPGDSVYHITKYTGETIATWLSRQFDIPCSIVRYFWPYSPYVRITFHFDKPIRLSTNPRILPKLYIADAVEKTIKAGEFASVPAQVFNVAGPDFLDEKEITFIRARIAGKEATIEQSDDVVGVTTIPDTTKMIDLLGPSRISTEEGLRRAYKANIENISTPEDWMFE